MELFGYGEDDLIKYMLIVSLIALVLIIMALTGQKVSLFGGG